METNKEIQSKIDSTFDAMDAIETVNVSPFFKDKTMQRLFSEKEQVEQKMVWSWFTPKLQLATLACMLVLNVIAFNNLQKSDYEENVDQFAETYGLSISDGTSLIN